MTHSEANGSSTKPPMEPGSRKKIKLFGCKINRPELNIKSISQYENGILASNQEVGSNYSGLMNITQVPDYEKPTGTFSDNDGLMTNASGVDMRSKTGTGLETPLNQTGGINLSSYVSNLVNLEQTSWDGGARKPQTTQNAGRNAKGKVNASHEAGRIRQLINRGDNASASMNDITSDAENAMGYLSSDNR